MLINTLKGDLNMLITGVVTFKEMQQLVKEETSNIAVREFDKDGDSMFESLVFDEAYESLFRTYFQTAQSSLMEYISGYAKDKPFPSYIFETGRSKLKADDYVLYLSMPCSFPDSMAKSVCINIEVYLKSWIIYEWYKTKLPEKANIFLMECERLGRLIRGQLNERSSLITRPNVYW